MLIKVAGPEKRVIGLGLCLTLFVASGLVSHYAFRILKIRHAVDVLGFSLDLVAVVAVVIGLGAVHLLAKPAVQ